LLFDRLSLAAEKRKNRETNFLAIFPISFLSGVLGKIAILIYRGFGRTGRQADRTTHQTLHLKH
jgi:hypothetical protein